MENNKKNIADTMEINAILAEAKQNRNPQPQRVQQPQRTAPNRVAPVKQTRQQEQDTQVDIQNGYIVYDDEAPAKNKKKSKAGIVALVSVLVLVLVLGGGFCAYKFFGEFKYANNVYVNDIAIGGLSQREAEKLLAQEEEKLANSININVTASDKSTTLTKDDFKYSFNTEEILNSARQYTEDTLVPTGEQKYTIAIKVDESSASEVTEKVATELNQKAVDALVTKFDSSKSGKDRFTVEEGKTGVEVINTEFQTKLEEFLSQGKVSGSIEAPATATEPKYTKEYLLSNIKELSSYSTVSTNGANGNNNMKVSAKACNNSIINPGEIWSFNKCTGDSNLESNGYKVAGVLIQGQSAQGVGGGICQTSTTIYNAGLLCGLEVEERRPHAFPSAYVPMGLDATIDYGNIDLKLKNIFDYQLFIESYMEGTTVTCKIYGLENPNFDEVKVSSTATSGTSAVASRTFYKDGKRVTGDNLPSEELPSSRYDSYSGGSSSSSSSGNTTQTPSEGGGTEGGGTEGGGTEGGGSEGGGTEGGGSEGGGSEGGGTEGGGSEGGGSEGGGSEGGGEVIAPEVPAA